PEYPGGRGYGSWRRPADLREVGRDWETYSSATGVTAIPGALMSGDLVRAMFIGMDPPMHDRLKNLFQRGFTPKRIAEHEERIREITTKVLDSIEGRETCDLVFDVAQPVVSRVIGSFMGLPEEDDEAWARIMNTIMAAGDPDLNPEGPEAV